MNDLFFRNSQSNEDKVLKKICFVCGQYLYKSQVDEEHLKKCLMNISIQKEIQCKSCYFVIRIANLFGHLKHKTVQCKSSYSSAEVCALYSINEKEKEMKASDKETSVQTKNTNQRLKKCKVCHQEFERLVMHITQNKNCKSGYKEEEVEKLRREAEVERRKYKTAWKNSIPQNEEKSEDQQCLQCQKQFKSLKQHLRQNEECQSRYTKEQISELNKKLDQHSKESKKMYLRF